MQDIELRQNKVVRWFLNSQGFRVLIMEWIATCVLMFVATGVANTGQFQGHPSEPNKYLLVYIALTVYILICFFGPFTGANINPAVSLSIYLGKPKNSRKIGVLLAYWIGQFGGGFLGVILGHAIYGNGGAVFTTMPQLFDLGKICLDEIFATFIFLFFILTLLNEETSFADGQAWVHLSIGIVYYFCLTLSPHLHHLNPAVTFALQFQAMVDKGTSSEALPAILAIIISQFFGGLLAHWCFRGAYLPGLRSWREKLSYE